ncbi:MAG: ABC transporter permease [bacterium]
MFKNYLKIAFRNFLRQKTYSFINILGLAIGMSCCILLLLFVQDELSYDRFHKNADRIYRVVQEFMDDGQPDHFAHTPAPLAPALMNDFPEIMNAVRFANRQRVLVSCYIKNKNLGYDKDPLVVLPIYYSEVQSKYESFKNEIAQNSKVLGATATAYLPSRRGYWQNAWWEGLPSDDFSNMIRWIPVDHDFIETLGIEIAAGRNFSSRSGTIDAGDEYILNESAVRMLGWKEPLGKQFKIIKKGTVIGVVKDFHFRSLHHKIEPVALNIYPKVFSYLLVRIRPENISNTLTFLKHKWQSFAPGRPFEYFFLDEDFNRIYKSETRLSKIFGYLAAFAIFIACLGLFGLAAFATERRTKEIGIRKVLGATLSGILLLLSKDFTKWVLLANIIACPIAYFAMNQWLQNYAYRINIGIWTFLLAGSLALFIALLTVGYQAIKAALANPVESLRYE